MRGDPLSSEQKSPVDPATCPGTPGKVAPAIDRNRCEGKEDCVEVCPCDVFEMGV
jgi:4Fe-4S ferredoxin